MLLESALASIAGVGITLAMYSDLARACCAAVRQVLQIPLIPGYWFGALIGGGLHNATRSQYIAGVAIEFFAVWLVLRWVRWHRANQRHVGSG